MLNEQTFEFSQARLKLRESLRFTNRQSGGGITYHVEDEVSGRFFRIGVAQYTFLTMLDGKRTVSTALMKTATLLREHAIDEMEAANLCKWAIESGLIESEIGDSAARRDEQNENITKQKIVSYLNPMTLRMPLFQPDGFVTSATRFLGWIVSPLGLAAWMAVVAWGFYLLASNWQTFLTGRVQSFGSNDLLWIAFTWLVLKVVHEFAHSLVCKKFGGKISSCGVMLLLLIPLPFVDVTSSWRFDNKWKRILTSAAGMLAELFIAAIACIVWAWNGPGPIQYHAGNVIIAATLHTLIFNVNPLMRFDGYYMLADFLEIPNLATHGRGWLKGKFKRLYFGNKSTPLIETGFRGVAVRIYGILAMAWFFMIVIGLSVAASSLFEGIGLVVVLIACVLWFGVPFFKFSKYLLVGAKTEKPNRVWFAIASSLTVACIGAVLLLCPAPSVVSAPVVIDYEPLSIVRTQAEGFVDAIHVDNGTFVQEGDLLIKLRNPELRQELHSLEIDIAISKLRRKALYSEGLISQVQLEQESLDSMHKRQTELRSLISKLDVFAPQSGTIIARDLDSWTGKFVEPGEEFLSIAQANELQAIALTRQEDTKWLGVNQDRTAKLLIWGQEDYSSIEGQIKKVNPRASTRLPHDAFSASSGGPLAVVPRSQVEGAQDSSSDEMILTQPRVEIELELSEADRALLSSGQTGMFYIRSRHENLGRYLLANVTRFIRDNNLRTHGL